MLCGPSIFELSRLPVQSTTRRLRSCLEHSRQIAYWREAEIADCPSRFWVSRSRVYSEHSARGSVLIQRASFHKSAIRRARSMPSWTPQVGTDPGLDSSVHASSSGPEHKNADGDPVTIRIVDYSSEDMKQHEVDPNALNGFLQDNPKPDWAKCRWVYVNGIDQEVLRSLGSQYKLHRLALEDVLESRGPIKADWYDELLFVAMPLHKLLPPAAMEAEVEEHKHHYRHHRRNQRDWRTIAHQKFNISVEQASIFLTNTGTVITIFDKSGEDVFTPVLNRLGSPHSVLKSANDPSMMLQAVIDVAVDVCMPIEKAFADEFAEMELTVLSNPAIQQSRSLYILRSRLTLLLDNFIAINSLLKKLCGDHPLAPGSLPLPGTSGGRDRINLEGQAYNSLHNSTAGHSSKSIAISSMTQLYLRDVLDHVHTLSASTDVAIRSTENLTSLIFNTIAASQNESVRQLTVVSSFFLPLTFLTGYMGMNFETMPVVQEHSDLVFWAIAGPSMIAMALFMGVRARRRTLSPVNWMRSRQK